MSSIPLKRLGLIVFVTMLLVTAACVQTRFTTGSNGINAADQRNKPYLVVVSIDGFRWDYQSLYPTPALDRIAASGVRAASMQPVFPTLTFPNHYSIATGLYPAQHGIVGNRFPNAQRDRWYVYKQAESAQDGSWYGGEPIWVSAEKNGLISAAYFFVGTEAAIGGITPTFWKRFDNTVPGTARISQALDWLAMPAVKRPHLITLYFEDVDVASHDYGPGSPQSISAIERVDGYLGELLDGIDRLALRNEVYVIVVSDHGQSQTTGADDPFVLVDHIDLDGLRVIDGSSFVSLYLNSPDEARARQIRDTINANWDDGVAVLGKDTPAHWRTDHDARFADITVLAHPNKVVISTRDSGHSIKPGGHGWDPDFKDMHGIFLAAGPRLPAGSRIDPISVVDVYPLMLRILDLPAPANIDMERATLRHLLQDQAP